MSTSSSTRAELASEALVALMVAAGHLTRDLNTQCEKHGITHDQYNVLRILRGVHPDGHPRGEISNRLITRAPDVTRMLDRLERRGLIKRGWDPSNRRLSIATITRDGLTLLQKVDALVVAEQARVTEGLTRADLESLRATCRSLLR
jgi:MarR family 2-MHQ and catechol resistance regulon transcriptional repressor